ncbi:UDP-N-acetylmuramoyl-L-alanine--D-glutamate ligase [Bacillus sp. HMF5848]|uniref:UDP-N-acetylmuramoyl-L-alanine--D-glutamate ligase n=1 Tax=Bacillus sp. HMF5848 TaxID=2495421 RepID=UPI000F799B67|nr:UDP-N-acetylmuramoyl-L-alanine--D-glutamate ligase [Bacillus sp. HMF5848]RSK26940.1 UDP-N-acetylmuramoyl-L-alanine--D-glutamate ligase [Bacillus sp. HMF5848]
MKNVNNFQNKTVIVLGLAKSGVAAAKLLIKLGAHVVVNDREDISTDPHALELSELGARVVGNGHPLSLLDDDVFCVVKNPGIPHSIPFLQKAVKKNIPIFTEVELAYLISDAPFIGITGSNGKTTTTTLIFEMLNQGEKQPLIAGNIGTVACEVAQHAREDNVIVTELSSFQLLGITNYRPKIAVLLNIFDAHLDYHGTREEYMKAKGNIFLNQTDEDFAVVNADDSDVSNIAANILANKVPFSTKQIVQDGAYIKDDTVYYRDEKIIEIAQIALPGTHNLENILAAICVAKLLNVDNKAICNVLSTFSSVKHRLQFVDEIEGRRFYNDSKATNILATSKALSAFKKDVILLAGGLDRGNEFDELIPFLQNVKVTVTFGQTAEKIEEACKKAGINLTVRVDNVEQAVKTAFDISSEGDTVLLSPACASWDQYKTFEERGERFIKAVLSLKKEMA